MGYPDDLLFIANELVGHGPPTQATLRRAVSTACYALFHRLIEDACRLWAQADHRIKLSRQFDHRRMKEASASTARLYERASSSVGTKLGRVAEAFVQLQQRRHECDYDLGSTVSLLDASRDVFSVELAFEDWNQIKHERIAQDYLFSLLFKDRS